MNPINAKWDPDIYKVCNIGLDTAFFQKVITKCYLNVIMRWWTSASQLLLKVSAFLKYATVSQEFKVKVTATGLEPRTT